jgi:hypothetical protein
MPSCQSQSHVTTDGQSVCIGVESTLELGPDILFCLKFAVLSPRGALSDERSDASSLVKSSQSYSTIDGQSASPSWCQASIWDPGPIFPLLSLIILDTCGFDDVGRPLRNITEQMSLSPHLKMETDPVSETLFFLVISNSGRWAKPKHPMILSVIHHLQNPLDSKGITLFSLYSVKSKENYN